MHIARMGLLLFPLWIGLFLVATVASAQPSNAPRRLLSGRVNPNEFGIQDDTITAIMAPSFTAISTGAGGGLDVGTPIDLATLGRHCTDCATDGVIYFATLNIPAGAVIDFIGVNSNSDADLTFQFALFERSHSAHVAGLVGFAVPPHDWDTDYDGPLNVHIPNNLDHQYILTVEQAPSPRPQFFGGVEIWWHRTVSAPPAVATFGDVPTSDPFFQFVEALAASGITEGCGAGNFCPDAALTRGQMAVFLAKALGLHFPD